MVFIKSKKKSDSLVPKESRIVLIAELFCWLTICQAVLLIISVILTRSDDWELFDLISNVELLSFGLVILAFVLVILSFLMLLFCNNLKGLSTAIGAFLLCLIISFVNIDISGTWTTEKDIEIRTHNFYFPYFEAVGQALVEYSDQYDRVFPSADNWPQVLHDELQIEVGKYPQADTKLALDALSEYREHLKLILNEKVSLLRLSEVSDKTVLIFASAEDWGVTYDASREKHKYIYAFLKDGSIVKHRLSDGAIAKYKENTGSFFSYEKANETDFRWEP